MKKSSLILIVFLVLSLISCTKPPVRYLALDASLPQIGKDSSEEVKRLLGPPDKVIEFQKDIKKWCYYNEQRSFLNKIPWIGSKISPAEKEILCISFQNNIVTGVEYSVEKEEK